MRKLLLLITLALISLTGCTTNEMFAIRIDDNAILNVGDIIKLTVNRGKDIEWTSSDPELAIVDENGIVTCLAPGIVDIYAHLDNISDSITLVIVAPKKITITGPHNVTVDQTIYLEIENNEDFEWTSSDEEIATVKYGIVKGRAPGLVTITASSKKGDIIATHNIYVKAKPGEIDVYKNIIESKIIEIIGDFDLNSLSERIKTIIENSKTAVVGVLNYQNNDLKKIGSGVIYYKETQNNSYQYQLLTNYHVIEKHEQIQAFLGYHDLEIVGEVVKSDENLDLAIVEFTSEIELDVLEFADPENIKIGDFAIAIGNPTDINYFGSVTFGIVSHPQRSVGDHVATFVQHDVAINPGNSGGPLINMDGKIIGINTLKYVSQQIDNLGFSIDIKTIRSFLNK